MAKIAPWHSTRTTDRPVYHDDNACTEGNNIEQRFRAPGTDGRRKCEHCQRLG